MAETITKISYLDGVRLHRALIAGIRQVISRQEYINKINVFPVPDRDTGTNMALTLNAIIEGTYTQGKIPINELLALVADSALNGARGNSGAILAQFFQGVYEGSKHVDKKMSTKNFVAAIATGVNYAHKALSEPKEGTILTVLRDFSDELTQRQLSGEDQDFLSLFKYGIARAEISLEKTAFQLKEMKKAHVVDAGAQGFVDFIHGIYEFIQSGSVKNLQEDYLPEISAAEVAENLREAVDERFRFCTECLIKGVEINLDELRAELEDLGNSLIVAGSQTKVKIHIHANNPQQIFDIARKYGVVQGEKADDMIHQQESFNRRDAKVAILTDSGADLPEGMISDLDIHVVPILINFGTKTFIDKVSMTPREFYKELVRNPIHPTTSQPSFGDFHRQYQYLISHYESIIALHIPRGISGTIEASEKAAKKVSPDEKITVIDSLNASTSLGLIVRWAAEAAKAGKKHQDIIEELTQQVIPNTHLYAAVPDLSFVTRGGRLPNNKKLILDFLKLTPIITLNNEGKTSTATLLPGRKNIPKKLAKFIMRKYPTNKTYRFAIVNCSNVEGAEELKSIIEAKYPHIDSIDVVDCGPALGAHIGPGGLGIGIQVPCPGNSRLI